MRLSPEEHALLSVSQAVGLHCGGGFAVVIGAAAGGEDPPTSAPRICSPAPSTCTCKAMAHFPPNLTVPSALPMHASCPRHARTKKWPQLSSQAWPTTVHQ